MASDSASKSGWLVFMYPPCAIPANELQPITMSQMQFDGHSRHIGKRTVIRVLNHPIRHNEAVACVVQDRAGSVAVLKLQPTCQPFEDVVPAKQILRRDSWYLIKEPWATKTDDGKIGLTVDHPGDIFVLPDDHEFIPNKSRKTDVPLGKTGEIRQKGNDAVGEKKWAEAEELYSAAIRAAETAEEASLAYLNRSLANIRLGRPATALADAIKSNGRDITAPTEKALFREASALYELAKYDQCLDRLQALKTTFPTNNSTVPMIDRVQARLNEQQTGQYDFSRMYKQAKSTPPLIDCATYTMAVEIRDSPGKGRGVFTKRKVLAGELVICEKAFGYVFGAKDHHSRGNITGVYIHHHLRTQIVQKLFHSIEDARKFAELHHGRFYDVVPVDEVDGKPVIDSFLVSRVINQTNYRSPRTSLSVVGQVTAGGPPSDELADRAIGVWSFISHINHSCISNTMRSFIGDMQIVRATRDIEAGEELLMTYGGSLAFESYEETQKRLSHWAFTCDCALCLERKATPKEVFLKRESLRRLFDQNVRIGAGSLAKARQALNQLEQTYSDAANQPGAVRMEEASFWQTFGREYTKVGLHNEVAIEAALSALEALGFVISAKPRRGIARASNPQLRITKWGMPQLYSIEAFRALYLAYKTIAPKSGCAQAAKGYMEIAYSLFVGEKETMIETYSDVA